MKPNTQTGLTDNDLKLIQEAAAQYPDIEALILFGSRAKGTYRKGSDVDIAVQGTAVDDATISGLTDQLNEVLPVPYFFDVLNYNTLAEPALKAHIDRVGLVIYHNSEGARPRR